MNENITTLAFSFNEERRIRYFLEALKNFSPIIVIDNYSTDNTVEIARRYTDKVYQYKRDYAEHPDCARYAQSLVSTEWVYWGRVDEIPSLPLLERLDDIVRSDACDVVLISRLNLLFGVPTKTWGDDHQIILFKKPFINVDQSALFEHGSISPDARILRLPATRNLSLWHFSSYDVTTYTNALNRYSTIAAKMIFNERSCPNPIYSSKPEFVKRIVKNVVGRFQATASLTGVRLFLTPIMGFFWHYIIRGGIKSGWAGLITSCLMMTYYMLIELKIWELERGISLESINQYYDGLKSQLIAGKIPDVGKSFPMERQIESE